MGELTGRLAGREGRLGDDAVVEPAVAAAYGVVPNQPTVVVLDPDLRVMGVVTGANPSAEVLTLLEAAVHRGPPTEVRDQAPVLFVPRVLDAAQRDRLIRLSEHEGGVETGWRVPPVARGEVLDASYKRRRDHTVGDPDLLRELSSVLGRRVMPEVRKAFAFRATRFEGFKITCDDAATGGFLRPHRDNLSPSTAHRVFALTLNLNDAYTGGQLRFPEYGNQRYRPDAGGALGFLLRSPARGARRNGRRRFVLLSFLYGEPASAATR